MICPKCREAGRFTAQAAASGKLARYPWYLAAARELHAECEAPSTCPCHHRLPEARG